MHDPLFQPYITAFNAQAQAMHQADPAVKVIGPAGTNEWQWWNRDSLGMFLKATGNKGGSGQVDGVSLHFYTGKSWYDSRAWRRAGSPPTVPGPSFSAPSPPTTAGRCRSTSRNGIWGGSDSGNAFNPTIGHALAVI